MDPDTPFGNYNRLNAIMAHTTRYAFHGQARLAQDAGVSRSTISRLIAGHAHPSFGLVIKVKVLLEQQLARRLDPCDLISLSGTYPTRSVCELCGCTGCLPDEAYDGDDQRRPAHLHLLPGQWSSSQGTRICGVGTADTS